jgi:hypothetical protein
MRFLATALLITTAACGDNSITFLPGDDGDVTVTVPSSVISIATAGTQGITATVRNEGPGLRYSRVGDASAGEEQDNLFAAEGSHATLERLSGTTWTVVPRPVAIEGTKLVRLEIGKNYSLSATFPSPVAAGIYRVRFGYTDVNTSPEAAAKFTANSATFEVR